MLWLYQRTMFGKLDNPENAKLKDLNFREMVTLVPIVACCFWIGLYPKPFFQILDRPVTELVERLEAPGRPAPPALAQGSTEEEEAPDGPVPDWMPADGPERPAVERLEGTEIALQ
jgi:NADH-quinone oxidoreductase subunit M